MKTSLYLISLLALFSFNAFLACSDDPVGSCETVDDCYGDDSCVNNFCTDPTSSGSSSGGSTSSSGSGSGSGGIIPNNYPVPAGANKCRTTFTFSFTTTTLEKDFSTPLGDWSANADGAVILFFMGFRNPDIAAQTLEIALPSLNLGSYQANQTTGLEYPSTGLIYRWSDTISDTSFDSLSSSGTISIGGDTNNYLWGNFEGVLGPSSPYTYIDNGTFACIP